LTRKDFSVKEAPLTVRTGGAADFVRENNFFEESWQG